QGDSWLTIFGSLVLVLAVFLGVSWVIKRSMPAGSQTLPNNVVEVLGRTSLGVRQHAHLIRCGNKLLLVSLFPSGAETLTEITDPLEVDRLVGLCQSARPDSETNSFRQVFQ